MPEASAGALGFFCSIYADNGVGLNVELVQATVPGSAQAGHTHPDDHPGLCSSHPPPRCNTSQLQQSSHGAAWSTGVALAVRTCWETAVSSLVLRSQAAGEAGHQVEASGDASSVILWQRSTAVLFFWQISLLTSGQADNEVSSCLQSL